MAPPEATFLFPGQGAADAGILNIVRDVPQFQSRYAVLCDVLRSDPLAELQQSGSAYLVDNAVSSLLTVFVSVVLLDQNNLPPAPEAYSAGYSVGQWTSLYYGQSVDFEQLLATVAFRAKCMDECFRESEGGMVSVIGIDGERLATLCEQFRSEGVELFISNYNSIGQHSLAGTREALDAAIPALQQLRPKRIVRLPVSGAWHCPLLKSAEAPFAAYLEKMTLRPPKLRLVDNVTGEFLPTELPALKQQLVRHLSSPVQWTKCIRTLIQAGCTNFLEMGYGNVLTNFGFFIDRQVHFIPVRPR